MTKTTIATPSSVISVLTSRRAIASGSSWFLDPNMRGLPAILARPAGRGRSAVRRRVVCARASRSGSAAA